MKSKLEKIDAKLNKIENGIKSIQKAIVFGSLTKIKKPVSFKGIATTNISEKELDRVIEESKKSLFPHQEI